MPENTCDRARDCPHETRLAIMESKIKALEDVPARWREEVRALLEKEE